jgi:hypothetical protein
MAIADLIMGLAIGGLLAYRIDWQEVRIKIGSLLCFAISLLPYFVRGVVVGVVGFVIAGFFFGPGAVRFVVPLAILVAIFSSFGGSGRSRQDEEYERYCDQNPEEYWRP